MSTILNLDFDVIHCILSFCDLVDILSLATASKAARRITMRRIVRDLSITTSMPPDIIAMTSFISASHNGQHVLSLSIRCPELEPGHEATMIAAVTQLLTITNGLTFLDVAHLARWVVIDPSLFNAILSLTYIQSLAFDSITPCLLRCSYMPNTSNIFMSGHRHHAASPTVMPISQIAYAPFPHSSCSSRWTACIWIYSLLPPHI